MTPILIVRTTVIVLVLTRADSPFSIVTPLTHRWPEHLYCLIQYCPYLPCSISRASGRLVDPSLILLSLVSYKALSPCPLIEFDTCLSPLVFVTSSESSSTIGLASPITIALVAIAYLLTLFIDITLFRLIALAILLHLFRVLQF